MPRKPIGFQAAPEPAKVGRAWRIVCPTPTGYGTRVWLGGAEIRHVKRVEFDVTTEQRPRLLLEFYPHSVEIEGVVAPEIERAEDGET